MSAASRPYVSMHQVRRAARCLGSGGVIAHPTEGVFGLACLPFEPEPVLRILELKGRALQSGLIVLAASVEAVQPLLADLPEPSRWDTIRASWPGPVTWVLPARPEVPDWLTGGRLTLAVRVTAHPLSAALCRAAGGLLVSTSANPSGLPPARSALKVRGYFTRGVDLIFGGTLPRHTRPTTIRDALTGRTLRG